MSLSSSSSGNYGITELCQRTGKGDRVETEMHKLTKTAATSVCMQLQKKKETSFEDSSVDKPHFQPARDDREWRETSRFITDLEIYRCHLPD